MSTKSVTHPIHTDHGDGFVTVAGHLDQDSVVELLKTHRGVQSLACGKIWLRGVDDDSAIAIISDGAGSRCRIEYSERKNNVTTVALCQHVPLTDSDKLDAMGSLREYLLDMERSVNELRRRSGITI